MRIVNVVLTSSCLDANGVPTWTNTELLRSFSLADSCSVRGFVALKTFLNVHVLPQFGLAPVRRDRFRELLMQFDLQFHFDHESNDILAGWVRLKGMVSVFLVDGDTGHSMTAMPRPLMQVLPEDLFVVYSEEV